jgi:predicted nucleic acid-binding protein
MTEAALLRLLMNPVVMGVSISAETALAQLRAMRATPKHEFLADLSTLAEAEIELTALGGYRQITDFHLVNLAASVGALFVTFDVRLAKTLSTSDKRHIVIIPSRLRDGVS